MYVTFQRRHVELEHDYTMYALLYFHTPTGACKGCFNWRKASRPHHLIVSAGLSKAVVGPLIILDCPAAHRFLFNPETLQFVDG